MAKSSEAKASQEFLRLYRRLVDFGAEAAIATINGRVAELAQVMPGQRRRCGRFSRKY
jgi:hypothetical protein